MDTYTTLTSTTVPPGYADAFGYTVSRSAADKLARCAWLYIDEALMGTVHLGVYSHGVDARPMALVARADIRNAPAGWSQARFEPPLRLRAGAVLWIAVSPVSSTVKHRVTPLSACAGNFLRATALTDAGALPNPFSATFVVAADEDCAAALYLGD